MRMNMTELSYKVTVVDLKFSFGEGQHNALVMSHVTSSRNTGGSQEGK